MHDDAAPRTRNARIDPATVNGWGVDADPRNDPTYPMRDRSALAGLDADWPAPSPQQADVEVLQSIEYNRRPAVFGNGPEPTAVSGSIRRAAFKFSENDWWHWLLLLGADRVNMVEGLAQDLAQGKLPNVPAEMGMPASWKHNRAAFTTRMVAISAAAAALAFVLSARRTGKRERHAVPRSRPPRQQALPRHR